MILNLKTIQQNFLNELLDAQDGKKTSLPFIIHQLSSSPLVKENEIFEVLVIGGSVWKKAFLQKTKTGIEIVKKETERSVDFKNEKDFLEFIDNEVKDNIKVLALNFAYPLKPIFEKVKLDGILFAVTKEGSFHDMIGKKVGFEIEKYILEKRNRKIKVSVANDTICLLLSGLTKYSFDGLAAGIVGTGLNFAFFLNKNRSVNLESASFDKFTQSSEGITVDKQSLLPERGLFEKETSGAYLYKHFNIIVKNKNIKFKPIASTEELDSISRKNIPQVSRIAQSLLERSAQLVACQIAGITQFRQQRQIVISRHSGKRSSAMQNERIQNLHSSERFWASQNDKQYHNMVFNMEGSLFWKANGYKETVEQTVKRLIPKYIVKFVEIKDSGIIGAAKLVT